MKHGVHAVGSSRSTLSFPVSLTIVSLALIAGSAESLGGPPTVANTELQRSLLNTTRGPADVSVPRTVREGHVQRYGLGFPFQVSASKAAFLCNLRMTGFRTSDFENGTDVIIFDNLSSISAEEAVPISRNEKTRDPETGQPRIAVKYPVIGGFVPLGAKRADGSPHPHAGTGFGICQSLRFPLNGQGYFSWGSKHTRRLEIHQLAYDGKRFSGKRCTTEKGPQYPRVGDSKWGLVAPGLTCAIPDRDGLLQPVQCFNGKASASGVVRWQRNGDEWRPAMFVPAPSGKGWGEPSLMRDTDGSLLFCARGGEPKDRNVIRVWRSTDGGHTWHVVVNVAAVRTPSPISLNRAADGTPYIAANPLGKARQTLSIWPLNPQRTGLLGPMVVRDALGEFGPDPGGVRWMVDHPSGAVVRLADGKWHNVLIYRILGHSEFSGKAPAPQAGCYVEEVLSSGLPIPTWRFDE